MKLLSYLNRTIEYCFYTLLFAVPLFFSGAPSELFEFPKMWLTFGLTILIGTAWFAKMILQKQFRIQKTPLDIPLLLFLASQVVSTIFSLDIHVSLWGYYSRFNGGLYSIISYVFLYYAFVSNFSNQDTVEKPNKSTYLIISILVTTFLTLFALFTAGASFLTFCVLVASCIFFTSLWYLPGSILMRTIYIGLISGGIVALWGFPSHFGWDPTCNIFRGSFDTSCWTDAFKPTIRIFSTLGQPAWMAAFMALLIPVVVAFGIKNLITKNWRLEIGNWKFIIYLVIAALFYSDLLFTNTRGGFIAFWIANAVFWVIVIARSRGDLPSGRQAKQSPSNVIPAKAGIHGSPIKPGMTVMRYFLIFNLAFLFCNFLFGIPIESLNKFTLPRLMPAKQAQPVPQIGGLEGTNITDSGKIRLLVWRGAIDAWRAHPIIGTGVETFAFAYYQYKPVAHNLTSEWDFLYNKAHNEYLNYLTTTGIFGLGSYIAIIGTFLFICFRKLITQNLKVKNTSQNSKIENLENSLEIGNWKLEIGLIAGYISILVSNFFGFSVVIINLYFFLIPSFVLILTGVLNPEKAYSKSFGKAHLLASSSMPRLNRYQTVLLVFLGLATFYKLIVLGTYWTADINYATGSNLDKAGSYQEALKPLQDAVNSHPDEPVYKDELSINLGTIATALIMDKESVNGNKFAATAIDLSDQVTSQNPNNVVFWKNRVRLFYTLAQSDKAHETEYLKQALAAISRAQKLAPNDAKISYNYGVLAGQLNGPKRGIEILEQTVKLKPDYRDAFFALGLYYHDAGENQKAITTYKYILRIINPQDKQVQENLKNWEK